MTTDTERAKTYALRLRTRRERLNLARAEVAAMVGISGRQFRRFENGETVPKLELLLRCCDALGVELAMTAQWHAPSRLTPDADANSVALDGARGQPIEVVHEDIRKVSSVVQCVDLLADELRKRDGSLTKQSARAAVWGARPDLLTEYQDERCSHA